MNDFNNLSDEDAEYVLNLPYHLAVGELVDDLCELLSEFEFINYKVISNKTQALIEDYNFTDNHKDLFLEIDYQSLKIIGKTLQLCEKNLMQHKEQLASQLWGRIQGLNYPKIKYLLNQIEQIQTPWLCPLKPTLHSPLTPLDRTLETNSDSVQFIAVTPDCKKEGRNSQDTIKIYDLNTGDFICSFTGDHRLFCCSFSLDNQIIIAGDESGKLHFFKIKKYLSEHFN